MAGLSKSKGQVAEETPKELLDFRRPAEALAKAGNLKFF
jgi:hypothetical protein